MNRLLCDINEMLMRSKSLRIISGVFIIVMWSVFIHELLVGLSSSARLDNYNVEWSDKICDDAYEAYGRRCVLPDVRKHMNEAYNKLFNNPPEMPGTKKQAPEPKAELTQALFRSYCENSQEKGIYACEFGRLIVTIVDAIEAKKKDLADARMFDTIYQIEVIKNRNNANEAVKELKSNQYKIWFWIPALITAIGGIVFYIKYLHSDVMGWNKREASRQSFEGHKVKSPVDRKRDELAVTREYDEVYREHRIKVTGARAAEPVLKRREIEESFERLEFQETGGKPESQWSEGTRKRVRNLREQKQMLLARLQV